MKPSNILVDIHGVAKITDFGISRFYKKNQNSDTRILGTPGYAAPEQFGFAQTDDRADIYSLGVLINRMLTGKLPGERLFMGDVRIGSVIRQCLNMEAARRCTVEDLVEALGGRPCHRGPIPKHLLKHIPGFRTGNKVHMTLAVIDYTYMGFLFLTSCILGGGRELIWNVAGLLMNTLVFGWLLGSFPAIAFKFNMERGGKRLLLVFIYAVIAFIVWYVGFQWLI